MRVRNFNMRDTNPYKFHNTISRKEFCNYYSDKAWQKIPRK